MPKNTKETQMETLAGRDEIAENVARGNPCVFLRGRRIDCAGAVALAQCAWICMLHLGNNLIGDVGAIALATLPVLRELDLSDNSITDTGAVALARNASLRTLYLGGNRIGDIGAAALARNATLENLYLENNALGDAGAAVFAQNTTLRSLYLNGNRISDASVIEIANTLEAGNACALSEAELCYVKRAIGQHAFGVLRRYVGAGNRSLRGIYLGRSDMLSTKTLMRIRDALRERQGWAVEVRL